MIGACTKKPPLVLLHGWAVNSNIWNPILDRLESEFELTIIDLPGYGSDTEYIGDYSLDSAVESVLSRAPEKANWVAWSLGGTIAVAAAIKFPERFEKLQLVSVSPRFLKCDDWEHGTNLEWLQKIANDFEEDYTAALRRFLLVCVLSPERDQAKPSVRFVRELVKEIETSQQPTKRNLQAGLKLLEQTDFREQLKSLTVETQVVAGKNDHVIPVEASQQLFDQLSNAHSIHRFETGHLPFLQASTEYIDALVSFIKPKTKD